MTMTPPEISIKELIRDGGLLEPWTDYNGDTQPAPKVQIFELTEDAPNLGEDDLILLIKNSGSGSGNFLLREPAMTISIFSDTQRQKLSISQNYAELVKRHISVNFKKDCIISANIIGDIAGPYRLQSGRRYFDLNVQLLIATGVTE